MAKAFTAEQQARRERHFSEILDLIKGGMQAKDACAADAKYPKPGTLLAWIKKCPQRVAAWEAALCPLRKFSERDYDQVLSILAANTNKSERDVFDSLIGKHLPGRATVLNRRRTDAEFAQRWQANIGCRRSFIQWRRDSDDHGSLLVDLIRKNRLYAEASSLVPIMIDAVDRDDLISMMMERMIGGAERADLAKALPKMRRELRPERWITSLDEPVKYRDRYVSVLDNLRTDDLVYEAAF